MDGETIFQLSNRIREYESAAAVVDALARFSTDKEAAATLRDQAAELRKNAAAWLDRQNREFGGPAELRRLTPLLVSEKS